MKKLLGEAAGWTTEAFETACGWALCAGVAYAILFVDIGGRGALGPHLRAIWAEGRPAPAIAAPAGVRVITLGQDNGPREDSTGYLRGGGLRTAVVAVQERPEAALSDVPADPAAGSRDWRRSLKGELRLFTVYGQGSETTSASAGGASRSAAPAHEAEAALAAAAPESAYRRGAGAASRPAVGGRARAVGVSGSDSVRNFR